MKEICRSCAVVILALLVTWLPIPQAWGQIVPPPNLNPLNQSPIPEPPQLPQFVKSEPAAIRLGKALFWDMQVGSDGIQACGSCHFSAGADNRMKNQLNPGLNAGDPFFGNNSSGAPVFPQFGPNVTLQPSDFPLHKRAAPADDPASAILHDTNDVVSSQGVRLSEFVDVVPGSSEDLVNPIPDPVFNVNGVNTRRVEPRNTPTVINAAFNITNFWDGRANFLFNGESPFGPADPNAGVWFNDPAAGLVKRPVEIQFASLASQAVGPPLSEFEMSARGRTFPKLGRKMLSLRPLAKQLVHPGDSVLGSLARATIEAGGTLAGDRGLNTTYIAMIQTAFRNNLWDFPALTPDGFTQMEANFSLFFGLAIQLYEATLVSDDTPFDRWLAGDPNAITQQQKEGFAVFFSGSTQCTACHVDIEFTTMSASNIAFVNNFDNGMIELMDTADGTQVIYDEGTNNTAVTPTSDDVGRGGTAPFINPLTGEAFPLSFSELAELQAEDLLPFPTPILDPNLPPTFPVNTMGAFKVPGLRNVELTAPYFHNGSMMTLEEVIDFYVRGGNFLQQNLHDLDPIIAAGIPQLRGDEVKKAALVAFLKSLTDERVRNAEAPFDHPEIFVPEGDPEVLMRIPATDGNGLTPAVSPLAPIMTSTAVTTATIGEAYGYDVNAFDPNGDPIVFSLVTSPAGMAIDGATGLIAWTAGPLGPHAVTARVQDPDGLFVDQSFTVIVSDVPSPPVPPAPPLPPTLGAPGCGDGILQSAEQCDDGNTVAGDGCGVSCQFETPPPDDGDNAPAEPVGAPAGEPGSESPGDDAGSGATGEPASGGGCSLVR